MHTRDELLKRRAELSTEQLALLKKRLHHAYTPDQPPSARTIPSRLPGEPVPLSFAQQRLWFLQQLEPDSAAYNEVVAVRLRGHLNMAALRQAISALADRHDVLRCTFPISDGQLIQQAHPLLHKQIALPVRDLRELSPTEREEAAHQFAKGEAQRPFCLAEETAWRASLLRLDEEEHIFLMIMHHIITDAWSLELCVRDLKSLYAAACDHRPAPLPELPVQYADYASWQQQHLKGDVLDKDLAYWQRKLSDLPPPLPLPADRPRPALLTHHGRRFPWTIAPAVRQRLQQFSRQEGVTLFMTLLAAFKTLLYRYSQQTDILIGSPIAGRAYPELESLLGCFVNTLALRTDLSGNPRFRELVQRVRQVTLEAYDHQELPFEKLVEELQPERDMSRNPLFQVAFVLQNVPNAPEELSLLAVSPVEIDCETARFDIALALKETDQELSGYVEYNTDLFDDSTIERIMRHFHTLLESAMTDSEQRISALPLLSEAERQQLLVTWNDTALSYPQHVCLHQLFEAQAEKTPDALAVVCENEQITYRELNQRANGLARYLRMYGVGPGVLVGICLERSVEMLVCILGVLKAGGAYVPLDPAYPKERLALMLAEIHMPVLLTTRELQARLSEHQASVVCIDAAWLEALAVHPAAQENSASAVTAAHLAYIIFTSGSSGRPKGVMITHNNIVNSTWARLNYYHEPVSNFLLLSSFSFDSSIAGIFWTLCQGGMLALPPPSFQYDIARLARLIVQQRISHLLCVPSLYTLLLAHAEPWQLSSLRAVVVAGESCPRSLAEFHAQLLPDAAFFNEYGPTEATVWSSVYRYQECGQQAGVPIGRPIGNMQLYVLDAQLEPAPIGGMGELYLGGVGIGRGYLHRPDLTAECFIPHPFSAEPGARLYRTGDLARYLPDGAIEFLGRADAQVKIRGFRVELGEIEASLNLHESVQESVALARENTHGDKRLVAYVVACPGRQVSAGELQAFLRDLLPEYMIPATMLFLDRLPLLPGGKVDRRALLALETPQNAETRSIVSPRDAVEEMLVGIWSRVLESERVGIHDDFFALGGHSLLAVQVIARIRGAFGVELPLRALMQASTIARLAEHIRAALQDEQAVLIPPLLPATHSGSVPLSYAQQRQWFLDQLDPGNARANVFGAVCLRGPLHVAALEQSVQAIVRRHEILRTTFAVVAGEDEPVQVIAPELSSPFTIIDLHMLPDDEREAEILRLVSVEKLCSFDLAVGPLLRVTLLRLAEEEHILLLASHHIIFDGWAINIFLRELAAFYTAFAQGDTPALSPLAVQYADYTRWQRQWLRGDALDTLLSWWNRRLADLPTLSLPTDRPHPALWHDQAATLSVVVPEQLTGALKELSRREGVTLFMTLLAAFQCVLARYSGQQDIAVGSPVANRRWTELEGLIGCFINTLVLRVDLSDNPTFRELLKSVREVALDAYAHQDAPVEKLVEALQSRRDLSRNPLFQALFALQNDARDQIDLPGLIAEFLRVGSETTVVDLDLTLWEEGGALVGGFKYCVALFDEPLIQRIKEDWLTLLELVAADPMQRIADLPLLSSGEQQRLLVEWNATRADYTHDRCIHELFEAQVERAPASVAVVCGEESLSYQQLNVQANQLARLLHSIDIEPGDEVAVYMDRALEMIPALLGILKAGGAYVPLEPAFPAARVQWILSSLHIRTLITQSRLLPAIQEMQLPDVKHIICLDPDPEQEAVTPVSSYRIWTRADLDTLPTANLPRQGCPDDLAYIIFTSGSTGTPKGVMVRHRPVINLIEWVNRTFAINAADRVLFITSLCFDLSVYDIFGLLAAGGSIQVVPGPDLKEPERVLALLSDAPITFWDSAPAALQQLVPFFVPSTVQANNRTNKLRLVFLSGDWIPVKLPNAVREQFPGAEVVSLGGATEATVWSNFYRVRAVEAFWPSIPYGKPIQNAQYYILDPYLHPCPVGVPGDLYIGGECLASGYANDPALTAQKFLPDPFIDQPGMRFYKTGDRARFWPDGTIEFLGRVDTQVKIRGFRVELGEIEAALARHPAVQVAVVEARAVAGGEKRLVAYVVARAGYDVSPRELRWYMLAQLPAYMVPAAFVLLDALPVTSNGKVDRRKLPALDEYLNPGQDESYVAPATPFEERMAELWAEVLHLRRVGIHDNFFEIGGHSLLSVQLITRVRATWSIELPLRSLFEAPTVAGLAARVAQSLAQATPVTGTQASVVDLRAESALDPALVPVGPYSASIAEPASIFLTGATGFLGAMLLTELLRQTSADIYCLVRCSSMEDGRHRLQHALESALLWQPEFDARIIPVSGDLEQPLLGLELEMFEQLADKLDVIYHSGTLVNTVYSYHDLKAANVLGTQEVLRLAMSGKVKPLHYVSTLSVFSPAVVAQGQMIREDESLDAHCDYLHEGYEQSKWVAEKLVVGARERGLPVAIYRPGRVTGHSQTGAWRTDDVLCRMIKGCIQLGSIPAIVSEDRLEMTPVDYVSQAIVALSRQKESFGKAFHLHNPASISTGDLVACVNEAGYPVRQVTYAEWRAALERAAEQAGENPLIPFLSLFPQRITEEQASQGESQPRVVFDRANTLRGLAGTSITCPPADTRLIATYLSYFERVGFLA